MALDLADIIGKNIVLFFNDGTRISRKEGRLIEVKEGVLFFKENGNPQLQGIPLQHLIRFEEVRGV